MLFARICGREDKLLSLSFLNPLRKVGRQYPSWHLVNNLLSLNRSSLPDNKMPSMSNWWANDCPAEHNRITANTTTMFPSVPTKGTSLPGKGACIKADVSFEGSCWVKRNYVPIIMMDGVEYLHNVIVLFTACHIKLRLVWRQQHCSLLSYCTQHC